MSLNRPGTFIFKPVSTTHGDAPFSFEIAGTFISETALLNSLIINQ
jgi:hypothetical protein